MRIQSAFGRMAVMVAAAMVAVSIGAFAQEAKQGAAPTAKPNSDELALATADAQKANQAALVKWSWKVKANLSKDGKVMATNLTQVRFNADGKLDATSIGGESFVEKKPGFRGRRQEKELEDFSKYLEGVLNQSFKYIFMSKGTLVDVFDRATITQSASSIDVAAAGVFVKGDKLSMAVDPTTKLTQKLNFTTTLEQDTITGAVTFAKMENGPNKATKWEIEVPTQAIKIASETYDWLEQK